MGSRGDCCMEKAPKQELLPATSIHALLPGQMQLILQDFPDISSAAKAFSEFTSLGCVHRLVAM